MGKVWSKRYVWMSHTYTVRRDEVMKKSWHVCEISCPDCASRTHIWAFETAITLMCPCQRLLSVQQSLCCSEQSSWSQARGEGGCRLSTGNVWNVAWNFKVIFFCYSGKVRIEGKVFHTILFKDLQQRGVHCSAGSLAWNPGLLGDFGQDPEQSQLPLQWYCPGIFHGTLPDPLMKKTFMLLLPSFNISECVPWVGHVQQTAGSDPSGVCVSYKCGIMNKIENYHKYLIPKVAGSGRMSETHFAVKKLCRKLPCCCTDCPTLPGMSLQFLQLFLCSCPPLLVLTKELQNFLPPGALLLPNCGEKFKEVALCTHLIQRNRNRGIV